MSSGIAASFRITRFGYGRGNYQRMVVYGEKGSLVYLLDENGSSEDTLDVCLEPLGAENHMFVRVPVPYRYRADQMQSFADILLGKADGLSATVADGTGEYARGGRGARFRRKKARGWKSSPDFSGGCEETSLVHSPWWRGPSSLPKIPTSSRERGARSARPVGGTARSKPNEAGRAASELASDAGTTMPDCPPQPNRPVPAVQSSAGGRCTREGAAVPQLRQKVAIAALPLAIASTSAVQHGRSASSAGSLAVLPASRGAPRPPPVAATGSAASYALIGLPHRRSPPLAAAKLRPDRARRERPLPQSEELWKWRPKFLRSPRRRGRLTAGCRSCRHCPR